MNGGVLSLVNSVIALKPTAPVKAASINNLKELGVDTSVYEAGS